MADVYVYHAAAGAADGSSWTNAYTTLAAACTAKAAGDVFWVADDHAETQASAMTITAPGTATSPTRIYCARRTGGSTPPVSADLRTTATITTTGISTIVLAGQASICYGVIFSCATGGTQANFTIGTTGGIYWSFVSCSLRVASTNNNTRFIINAVRLDNTTFGVAAIAQGIQLGSAGRFIWKNTASCIAGATIPTTIFPAVAQGIVLCEGVDFSQLTSGKSILTQTAVQATCTFKNCKLSTTGSLIAGTGGHMGAVVDFINCDSGSLNYRNERYHFATAQTTETTIVLTGGATDGTTPVSWKVVTSADTEKDAPFEVMPITIWNDTSGSSKTVTIQGIWGGGSVPNNDDIWMDVAYLNSSSFPTVAFGTCGRADPLAAGSGLTAGTGTWGGSTTKFALAVTFTPQMKGPVTCYIKCALASSTFYLDPKPVIT
jgi:hypothetical protein